MALVASAIAVRVVVRAARCSTKFLTRRSTTSTGRAIPSSAPGSTRSSGSGAGPELQPENRGTTEAFAPAGGGSSAGCSALLALFVLLVAWLAITAPLSKSLQPIAAPQITLLAADGTPIARNGAMVDQPVEIEKLPAYVPQAFIAIEDRRFYRHWGIDPKAHRPRAVDQPDHRAHRRAAARSPSSSPSSPSSTPSRT